MNLILHQLKTDLRRFRSQILLLWIAFAAGPIVLVGSIRPEAFAFVSTMAMLWQVIGGVFLTVSLVQADPLVGTSAQWLGRPIRRCHLFWAKTLFLLGIVLMPRLLFQSAGWLARGYSTEMLFCALTESALYAFTVIFSAAVLAALTRDLARFFLASGILAGGIFLWLGTVSILLKHGFLERSVTSWRETASLNSSKEIMAFTVLAACGLVAWFGQAYARRWRLAVVMLAAGVLAFPVIATCWSRNFLKTRLTNARPLSVQIIQTNSVFEGQKIFAEIAVNGIPEGKVPVVQELQARFSYGGTGISLQPNLMFQGAERVRPENSPQIPHYLKEIKGHFPADTLWFEQRSFWGFEPAFRNEEAFRRFNTQSPPGELRGSLEVDLYSVRKVAELPLISGSVKTMPGQQAAIRRVSLSDNMIAVFIEESMASLKLDRNPLTSMDARVGTPKSRNTYVLFHPKFGEAYLADQRVAGQRGVDAVTGEVRLSFRLAFRYSALRERLAGVSAADWLKEARLWVFVPVYNGTANLMFHEENYTWKVPETSRPWGDNAEGIKKIEEAILPPRPTEAQLEAYLDTILFNAPDDLWLENVRNRILPKLSAIGTNGLPVLIRRLPLPEQQENYLVFPIIRQFANREHLPDLLAALERNPRMTRLFVEKGWQADAGPVLLRMAGERRRPLPAEALLIVAASKNPETYNDLRWHFVRLRSGFHRVISSLERCPGFDLAGAVSEAWDRLDRQRVGDLDIVVAAAKLGLPDALPRAVVQLEDVGDSEMLKRMVPELAKMTGYSGPLTNAVTWFGANLDRLRFDPSLRRYVVD